MTDRSVAGAAPARLREFLSTETGSTAILLLATVVGLVWANLPFGGDSYEHFWHSDLSLSFGDHTFGLSLQHWVNDGLMTLFFFVIGLEISREIKIGQLRDRRLVAVPFVAAVGGMVVPALIYYVINAGGEGAGAWGIPMASDTAFVLGLLTVLGTRCPGPLRAFLLTLAVVDDVGAILVIAVFYTEDLKVPALLLAVGLFLLIVALRWAKVWRTPAYVLLGIGVWAAMLESGVHPTLAGIMLGILVNVYVADEQKFLEAGELVQALSRDPSPELARAAAGSVRETISINEWLQLKMGPWVSYLIVPIFAMANAGVKLNGETLSAAARSPITWGIVAGLVVGKFVGIALGTWIPLRLNWGDLPGNLVWGQLLGGAAVAGIGFTVSLFITDLAFTDAGHQSQAKIGIIAGSVLAAALGWVIFRVAWNRGGVCAPPKTAHEPDFVPEPLPPVTGADHTLGPAGAPVTLVEYGDYECPYCGRFHLTVLPELRERYGDSLRYVFRHFPLSAIHPSAVPAAVASENADDHGVFWELHDRMFSNQLNLSVPDLTRYTRDLGFEPWEKGNEHADRVVAQREGGQRAGVEGTPTFFVNGVLYDGPYDLAGLSSAIDTALEHAEAASDTAMEGMCRLPEPDSKEQR